MLSMRASLPRILITQLLELLFQAALLCVVLCLFVRVFSFGETAVDFTRPADLFETRAGYSIFSRILDGTWLSVQLIGGALFLSTIAAVALGWLMVLFPAAGAVRFPLLLLSAFPVFALGYWLRTSSDLPYLLQAMAVLAVGDLVLMSLTSRIAQELHRELKRGYILSARARGAAAWRQYWRRLLVIACESVRPRLPFLLGSSVVVESVFALDGLGLLAVNSVRNGEVAVLLWLAVLSLMVVRMASLFIELLRTWLTPETQQKRSASGAGLWQLVSETLAALSSLVSGTRLEAFDGDYSSREGMAVQTKSEKAPSGLFTGLRHRPLFDRILIVAGLSWGALSLLFLLFCFFGERSAKQTGNPLELQFQAPSSTHWLGLDEDGQDILDRIRVAGRMLTPPCLATLVGVILLASPLGLLSGYYETRTARLVERLFDVLDSVPKLVLVLLAIVVFEVRGAYLWKIIPFIGMTFAPAIFYQVREGALLLRQRLFVERARALGCSEPRIVFLHILWKNCLHRVVIASAFILGGIILMDGSIGYLNLSQPDYPTWGGLVAEGIASADDTRGTSVSFNSWALWGPAGVLAMMLMSFTLAAEALERLWTRD